MQEKTVRARSEITYASHRRSIPPGCVADRFHTDGHVRFCRLARWAHLRPIAHVLSLGAVANLVGLLALGCGAEPNTKFDSGMEGARVDGHDVTEGKVANMGGAPSISDLSSIEAITPVGNAKATGTMDQDDMAFWIHPTNPTLSTLIASDKSALSLNIYDNQGISIQTLQAPGKPGNIDVRYGLLLGGKNVDIVAFNDRSLGKIMVYGVDESTRRISRMDNDAIVTGAMNYGLCLYKSASKKMYAFVSFEISGMGKIEQYQLMDDGAGKVKGSKVREWTFSSASYGEACVADDGSARLYYADEDGGIYEVGAEPSDPVLGRFFTQVGENGLTADVEGLTIYPTSHTEGYLVASSQGSSQYLVYDRKTPHAFLGLFAVAGATHTDGIEVTNVDIGGVCSGGCFVAHGGDDAQSNFLVKWGEIAAKLKLKTNTTYNPRQ